MPDLVAQWAAVVPVKGGPQAKSRLALPGAARSDLANAFARDTVAAVIEALEGMPVLVVTSDPAVSSWVATGGARLVPDPGLGLDAAVAAGVDQKNLIIDPGLGFAKTAGHNWALLHALPDLVATGLPVLVGASRKRFLGTLLADDDGAVRPPDGRETATAVISALSGLHGAWGVRVHDVRASVDALQVVRAWARGGDRDG